MQKPLVPGIRIQYQLVGEKPSFYLRVEFFVGEGSTRSGTFVSTKELRDAIWRHRLSNGTKIGFMGITVYKKLAQWEKYYPFHPTDPQYFENGMQESQDFTDILGEKGIAEQLEEKVIIKVKKLFPQVKKMRHLTAGDLRKQQMYRRGFTLQELREGYSYRRAKRRVRQKIQKSKKKARLARRP